MGKFDDNRYVEGMKAEFEKADKVAAQTLPAELQKYLDAAKLCAGLDDLMVVWAKLEPAFPQLKPAQVNYIKMTFGTLKQKVAPGSD
jgi:hypothetical protein